ncbi:MAG: TetR/AcrR family transcriptional regulator [Sphingomonadales bacterium]|jgi:AcrR family transcriptional regulator
MKEQKLGRPRSDRSRKAILNAANKLLQAHPLPAITMDQIAAEAGVSKATLYRWWGNKVDVLVDAFVEDSPPRAGQGKNDNPLDALISGLEQLFALFTGSKGRIIADIIGHGRDNPVAVELFKERFLEPRRGIARQLIEAAKLRGELRFDLDTEVALDMVFAPLYYRLLVQHLPLGKGLCEAIKNILYRGFR